MTSPNEQQRVEVLMRMDGFIGSLQAISVNTVSLEEARAAVAELIDATAAEYAAQAAYDNAATGKQRNETWDAVLDARKRRITAFLNAGGVAP